MPLIQELLDEWAQSFKVKKLSMKEKGQKNKSPEHLWVDCGGYRRQKARRTDEDYKITFADCMVGDKVRLPPYGFGNPDGRPLVPGCDVEISDEDSDEDSGDEEDDSSDAGHLADHPHGLTR